MMAIPEITPRDSAPSTITRSAGTAGTAGSQPGPTRDTSGSAARLRTAGNWPAWAGNPARWAPDVRRPELESLCAAMFRQDRVANLSIDAPYAHVDRFRIVQRAE